MAEENPIKKAAEWCEQQANEALDRGLDFATVAGGQPVSAQADFERAGSLFAAAAALKKRAKDD